MENFNWPYFTIRTMYPESTIRFRFGRSYQFAVPPSSPDQRIFTLRFPTLIYFETSPGSGVLDITTDPDLNLGRLEDFYNRHKLFQSFSFTHPAHGALVCKFNKPLEIPDGLIGGTGAVEEVTLEFIEVP